MPKAAQRSKAEVENMSAEQISRALHAGELEDYLTGQDAPALDQSAEPEPASPPSIAERDQLTEADLERMTPEQIVAARKQGRLISIGVAP